MTVTLLVLALMLADPSVALASVQARVNLALGDVLYDVVLVLLGAWFGFLLCLLLLHRLVLVKGDLPHWLRERYARCLGMGSLADRCAAADRARRAHYATILVGTLHDLGGPRLLAPGSEEAFRGMLREAERRYAEAVRPEEASGRG